MERIDDTTVLGGAVIWRRVPHWHVSFDPKVGGCRVSTGAFEDDDDGDPMSACLAHQDTTLEQFLAGHSDFAVVAFQMEVARAKGLGIMRRALPGEPDHVEIFGKKTYAMKKALVQGSRWVVPPPLQFCRAPEAICTCFPR